MKNIKPISLKAVVLLLATAFAAYSCKKDDAAQAYTLTITPEVLYYRLGETQTVSYVKSSNISGLIIASVPEGWNAVLNPSNNTLTVTAPDTYEADAPTDDDETPTAEYGTVVLRGTVGDRTASAALWVTLREREDLTGQYANCFIIDKPLTGYFISAARPDGSAVEGISSADAVWMSGDSNLIRFVEYKDGKIAFRTTSDDNDEPVEGNALLAARDSKGNILWCWHLWVTKGAPEANAVTLNGHTFMGCNLGAFANATDNDEQILASYGLYYQWGRPTPFPRPRYYNCADSESEPLYSGNDSYTMPSMKSRAADSDNSTMASAIANPLVFVTGLTAPWSNAGSTWNDSAKSLYDPCPKGWRVPSADAFAGLMIDGEELAADPESLREAYGWTLTDGEQSAFFFAGGRRSYLDGSVANMNTQENPQPWEGFYWTTSLDSSRQKAAGLFFDLNTVDATASRLTDARQLQLSNGLQIRCVKE